MRYPAPRGCPPAGRRLVCTRTSGGINAIFHASGSAPGPVDHRLGGLADDDKRTLKGSYDWTGGKSGPLTADFFPTDEADRWKVEFRFDFHGPHLYTGSAKGQPGPRENSAARSCPTSASEHSYSAALLRTGSSREPTPRPPRAARKRYRNDDSGVVHCDPARNRGQSLYLSERPGETTPDAEGDPMAKFNDDTDPMPIPLRTPAPSTKKRP